MALRRRECFSIFRWTNFLAHFHRPRAYKNKLEEWGYRKYKMNSRRAGTQLASQNLSRDRADAQTTVAAPG